MRGRRIGVVALLIAGTILWTVGGLAVWVKRQAIDTDNWVNTSSELLESEPVRTALSVYIVNQLFASADVQDRLEEVLPPQLQPLAGPASAALKQVALREAPRVLGSAVAVDAWRKANEVAHGELIQIVEGKLEDSSLSLNLGQLVDQVAQSAGLPEGVADRLPPQVSNLTVAKPDELETIQNVFDLFETLVWVFVLLAVASFAGALALSQDRRRTTITVGGCLILSAFLIFAIRRLGERWVLDTLAESPNAEPAASDAWQISTSLLGEVAQGSLLFGLFVVLGAWLAGAGRRATAVRRFSAHALRENPGYVFAGLGVAILLLVTWGPVPWTQRIGTMLIFTALAFGWLEWMRRRVLAEFPDEPAPRLSLRRARASPEGG